MQVAAFQPFSLIDYPGKIAAILFTQGCMFRCHFCHNPELVLPNLFGELLSEDKVMTFLESRRGKLDGVVITGGEPTLHAGLGALLHQIKKLGFLVKLDTAGVNPERVSEFLDADLIDYIAMDVKAPLDRYEAVVGRAVDTNKILASIDLIKSRAPDYEFRTTVVEGLHSKEDVLGIGELIRGAKRYALQRFVPTKTVDPDYMTRLALSDEILHQLQADLMPAMIETVIIR